MLKAILVDVDNTLLDFNKCAEFSIKKALSDIGISFNKKHFLVFNKINNNLWQCVENGSLTKEKLHKIRWNLIFEKLNIDFDGVEFEKLFFKYLCLSAEPVDGAVNLLKYLSDKYIVCAASNASYNQQITRLQKAGMLQFIDKIFVSEKIGFSKPSKNFFAACLAELGNVKKDEVMIIGDSLSADIKGGYYYGIKTCWYNHNKEEILHIKEADFIVKFLNEIKSII